MIHKWQKNYNKTIKTHHNQSRRPASILNALINTTLLHRCSNASQYNVKTRFSPPHPLCNQGQSRRTNALVNRAGGCVAVFRVFTYHRWRFCLHYVCVYKSYESKFVSKQWFLIPFVRYLNYFVFTITIIALDFAAHLLGFSRHKFHVVSCATGAALSIYSNRRTPGSCGCYFLNILSCILNVC